MPSPSEACERDLGVSELARLECASEAPLTLPFESARLRTGEVNWGSWPCKFEETEEECGTDIVIEIRQGFFDCCRTNGGGDASA